MIKCCLYDAAAFAGNAQFKGTPSKWFPKEAQAMMDEHPAIVGMELEQDNEDDYTFYIRRHYLRMEQYNHEDYWQRYRIRRRQDGSYWINKNTQPMIGATDLTDVYLEHLSIKLLDEKRVKVSIAGLNQKTGHRFALERVFYSYGYGLTPIVEEEGATV